MEEWRDIEGYEGLYQISNEGRVKRLENEITCWHARGKKFITIKNKEQITCGCLVNGYCVTSLTKNKISKNYLVHRLVAEAFIDNPENKPCIDHINTVRNDNRVCNLRWCTQKENMNNEITKKKIQDNPCKYSTQFNRC